MRVILVDDEPLSLELFKIECGNMPGFDVAGFFDNPVDALNFARNNPVDFALLDIDMPEMSGIELAKKLRAERPDMIIIFVTAHPEFSADAINARADFVVFKPYERDDIINALEHARLLSERQKKRVRFRTFGHFDMFVDGRLISFKSSKAKELLALCVSRLGGEVTIHEMIATLWPESGNHGLGYRTTIKALSDTLKELDAGELLHRKRSAISVKRDAFDCDLAEFKAHSREAMNAYHGEFMQQYGWARPMAEELSREKES